MNDSIILVSVICNVYNHERYLRKCLDGFIKQKTSFKYEVLVHDDASTDNSVKIIKEYEKLYPDIIKPIYQKENQYSKGIPLNWKFCYPRAQGKYIALCEGDDFWIDDHKLQSQCDELETHSEAIMSVHRVCIVNENGVPTGRLMPTKQQFNTDKIFTRGEWINIQLEYIWYFQTSCYFFRKVAIENIIDNNINIENFIDKRPMFMKIAPIGDEPLMLYLCQQGGLVYINKEMSSYRICSEGSWSIQIRDNYDKYINILRKSILMLMHYDEYTNYSYSDKLAYKCLRNEFKIYELQKKYKKLFELKFFKILTQHKINEVARYFIYAYFPKFNKTAKMLISKLFSRNKIF